MEQKLMIYLAAGILLGWIIGYLFGKMRSYSEVKKDRKRSINQSQKVILGGVYEKILPMLPGFPYNPQDMVFVGKGVDYIVFDGLTAGKVNKVVFLEVKTGKSRLNLREQKIRACVNARSVEYQEWRG